MRDNSGEQDYPRFGLQVEYGVSCFRKEERDVGGEAWGGGLGRVVRLRAEENHASMKTREDEMMGGMGRMGMRRVRAGSG